MISIHFSPQGSVYSMKNGRAKEKIRKATQDTIKIMLRKAIRAAVKIIANEKGFPWERLEELKLKIDQLLLRFCLQAAVFQNAHKQTSW